MNGETQIILERLAKLETKQEERHAENVKRMEKLNNLPCEAHKEKFKVYDSHISEGKRWRFIIVTIFVTLVIQGLSFARSWGSLKAKVESHLKQYKSSTTLKNQ